MSKLTTAPRAPLLNTALVLLTFVLSACTERVPPSPIANANLVIALTEEEEFLVLDRDGTPLSKCELCSDDLERKYGKNCGEAPRGLICKGLAGGTVTKVDSFFIFRSKGSYCITVYENGKWKQKCYG
ncbi:MAG: hypothetical protein MN733_35755 [Nitrososphaera sp.]|nr:hypothetical protein [Nitrososphaera sp.]